MKFTLGWLHEHLDTHADLAAIAAKLTLIGLEVGAIEDPTTRLAGFEVAEIIDTVPHPDADKLKICTVKSAAGTQNLVCGAPNARAGLKGVLARPGAVIPTSGMVLGKAKIRGVESNGMMCSGAELGVSNDHEGIIELPESAIIGTPAAEALEALGSFKSLCQSDLTIEIAITPNRPDCLGVRGIARDLAAAGLGTLKPDPVTPIKAVRPAPVDIQVSGGVCLAFAGCVIEGVSNKPSPDWLQDRLRAIGLTPINALVDITNYICVDRGRPLHVYDSDTLTGKVEARQARPGECFKALDEKTYTLTPDDCVIADAKAVLGLGGIMGGLASGSTLATRNVLLESAWFEPVAISISGRYHHIESDARYRFERGVDRASIEPGLHLAVQMIVDICGGTPTIPMISGDPHATDVMVKFAPSRVRKLTGLDLREDTMHAILTQLGFQIEIASGQIETASVWHIKVPGWRPDIGGGADIVEEIARIYGLDQVPVEALPIRHDVTHPTLTRSTLTVAQRRVQIMRRALAGRGLVEAMTWSFISQPDAVLFGVADGLELENPISSELSHMRPSLLPGLLAASLRNADRGHGDLALFEIGNEFIAAEPGAQRVAASGVRHGADKPRRWQGQAVPVDAYQARVDAEAALAACGVLARDLQILPPMANWYHPGRSGVLARNPEQPMAAFGAIHPLVLKHFGLSGPAVAFEVWPETVPLPKKQAGPKKQTGHARSALNLSNLQAVCRDFAFEVARDIATAQMVRAAKGADKRLIADVRVFDVFEGESLGRGLKSVALEVTLQPVEATLTDAEIDAVAEKVIISVKKASGGKLRG